MTVLLVLTAWNIVCIDNVCCKYICVCKLYLFLYTKVLCVFVRNNYVHVISKIFWIWQPLLNKYFVYNYYCLLLLYFSNRSTIHVCTTRNKLLSCISNSYNWLFKNKDIKEQRIPVKKRHKIITLSFLYCFVKYDIHFFVI